MAYELSPIINVRDNTIRVKHPNIEYNPRTYLAAAIAATGTSLTVRDNAGFLSGLTNNERVIIGSYGDERAEIRRITADPAAGTTIAVVAVIFAHPIDTPITQIIWDQVEIYGNTSNTPTGATLLATLSITVDEEFTQYIDTSGTAYTHYFARYRNSTIPRVSSYSDGVANTGYGAGSRAMIKQRALARAGVSLGFPVADGEILTDEFLNAEIISCELDIQQRSRKWAFLLVNNHAAPIGLVQGQRQYTLPTTIQDNNSNDSIVSVRISWNRPLVYITPQEFNARTSNVVRTTLAAAVGLADVTITLTDSGDFTDSGDILIGNDTISYTANNRTTNVLSGVTAISVVHSSGDEVYQNAATGLAIYYTIQNGNIILHPLLDNTYHQRNLNMEFYRTIIPMDSDGDVTAVPFYNVFELWLLWKIAERRKIFEEATKYEAEYEKRILQALQRHVKAEEQHFYPGMAEPQLLEYDRGRIISSTLN